MRQIIQTYFGKAKSEDIGLAGAKEAARLTSRR